MAEGTGIAVIFPGIGYTCEKPLLYYAAKLAMKKGFEIRRICYKDMPSGVKGDKRKMKLAFLQGLKCAEEELSDVTWKQYSRILFIGKSVGTVIAAAFANKYNLPVRSICYTPVEETFLFADANSIMFHGTADPWAVTSVVQTGCQRLRIPLYLTENANHSLETGDLMTDLDTLKKVMLKSEEFIAGCAPKRRQPLRIRKCLRQDLYPLVQMYNRVICHLEEHVNYPKWKMNDYPSYESVRLAIEAGSQYAAFEGENCVGAFILNQDVRGDDSKAVWKIKAAPEEVYYIHTLAVDPERARLGIAEEMVEYCIVKAREEQKKAIRLDVVPGNEPAIRLYEKMKFTSPGKADLGRGIKEIPVFQLYERAL